MHIKTGPGTKFLPRAFQGAHATKRRQGPPLPLVSIVTPSYGQGQFIEETILSVRYQDYPNIEHIIVDGGSTDATLAILEKYGGSYNMRWTSGPDEGQSDAIQKGFDQSSGDILCWLNSDDTYVRKTVIKEVVSLFFEYPEVHVVTGGGVRMSEQGRWEQLIDVSRKRACYKHLRFGDGILQPATFFRRCTLDSVQLDRDLHYAFDWDYFIQLSRDYNVLAVNETWASYRAYGQNKTMSGGARRVRELLEVTGRYLGRGSWQYWVVGLFYFLHLAAERMPAAVSRPIKSVLRRASQILSLLTYGRLTGI